MTYDELARKAYGHCCEWKGCGWDEATCDVHHISYQLHQEYERQLRYMFRVGAPIEKIADLLVMAKKDGFLRYDRKTSQLEKDDRVSNLTVLCPNHHRYVHHHNLGMDILKFIPPRKSSV